MSEKPDEKASHSDHVTTDRKLTHEPAPSDMHSVRNAPLGEIVKATRPHFGDGSMRRFSQANLDSQNESIEIDFGSHVVSRESKLTERQVEAREAAHMEPQRIRDLKISQGVRPEEMLHLIDVTLSTTAGVLAAPFLHLTENNAINRDIANFIEHFRHDSNQFNEDATKVGFEVLAVIDKPMTSEERARLVGMLIPLFFLPGETKPLDPKTVESMNLEHLTETELAERNITRRVVEVYRGDKTPFSPVNSYGHRKSFVDKAGDLVPANPAGMYNGTPVDIVEHLNPTINRPAKSCSPYTSFTESASHATAEYGKFKIKLNLEALRHDINSGALKNVEIIDQSSLARHIDMSKHGSLLKQNAFENARAEREILVKGIIPKKYFKVEAKKWF